MADVTSAPVNTAPEDKQSFVQRELTGASFLTLEHVGHMLLVVMVPALVAVALTTAIDFWLKSANSASSIDAMTLLLMNSGNMHVMMAVSIAAALLVLTPLLVVLGKRTRAEWLKRPGYTSRLAYKVPVYTALGLSLAGVLLLKINLLSIIIESLVHIGVQGTDFGGMYLHQFLPSFISYLAALGTAWYLFKLAKGREKGKMFDMVVAGLAAVLSIALLIIATIGAHETKSQPIFPGGMMPTMPSAPSDMWENSPPASDDYDNLYNY